MLLCIFTKRRTTWLPQCSFHVALLLKCSCKLHFFTFCKRQDLPIQGYLPEAVNLLPKTGFFVFFRLLGWNPAGFHLAIHGKKELVFAISIDEIAFRPFRRTRDICNLPRRIFDFVEHMRSSFFSWWMFKLYASAYKYYYTTFLYKYQISHYPL